MLGAPINAIMTGSAPARDVALSGALHLGYPLAEAKRTLDVVFVAIYSGVDFVSKVVGAARHLNATSVGSTEAPHFHAVVRQRVAAIPAWCAQHVISDMPTEVVEQHRNLSRGKPKGAAVYLWKAFLYRLLPLDRAIVLDLDLALVAGSQLDGLWSHFDAFGPHAVLGLAMEQGPTYARLGQRAGYNGGVQLHHLTRMRAGWLRADATPHDPAHAPRIASAMPEYDAMLRRCAAGRCTGWDQVEPSLGDQTLYTHLCHSRPHLCTPIPCGWNRQMSTRYYSAPSFASRWHVCASRCHLLHFNQPLLEKLVPVLQREGRAATCLECRLELALLTNHTRASGSHNPKFTWGASKQYMAGIIEECCCTVHTSNDARARE